MVDPKKLLKKLKSYESFKSLTKAIQMVALSQLSALKWKIGARQLALSPIIPYFNKENYSEKDNRYIIISITMDKSCCGSHNSNILKATRLTVDELKEKNKNIKLISIGKKAKFFLRKYYRNFQLLNIYNIDKEPLSLFLTTILTQKILSHRFDRCLIIFNRFYSAFTQKVSKYDIYNFSYFSWRILEDSNYTGKYAHLCSTLTNSIENNVLYPSFLIDFYTYCFSLFLLDSLEENEYSALGARATAMNNATKNVSELIDKYRLLYNKARQDTITNELIEIVSCVNFVG